MKNQIKLLTHTGKVRQNNEDSALALDIRGTEHCKLLVVCDGVGGKQYGEIASKMAIDTFQSLSEGELLAITTDPEMRAPMLDMSARRAHQEIANESQSNSVYQGMSTTLVAAIYDAQSAGWVAVGDSRLYHFSDGQLQQISQDQTVARALLEDGRIGADELANHPDKNTLLYCLGLEAINDPIQPQSGLFNWRQGDMILLCSDGLSDMVDERQIQNILNTHKSDVTTAAEALLQAALDAGGKDNITLILALNHN